MMRQRSVELPCRDNRMSAPADGQIGARSNTSRLCSVAWARSAALLAARFRAPLAALTLLAYPLTALAQGHDDDEKYVPLDPVTQRAQLLTFGVIAALVIGVVVFYYVRRWQLMHSSNFQEGFEQDED